jgi:hypothetical protein
MTVPTGRLVQQADTQTVPDGPTVITGRLVQQGGTEDTKV